MSVNIAVLGVKLVNERKNYLGVQVSFGNIELYAIGDDTSLTDVRHAPPGIISPR